MVGNGAQVLLTKAFAARGRDYDPAAFDVFLADYTLNSAVETRAYPGVPETLRHFADNGVVDRGLHQQAGGAGARGAGGPSGSRRSWRRSAAVTAFR